jgi:hypothetical protein
MIVWQNGKARRKTEGADYKIPLFTIRNEVDTKRNRKHTVKVSLYVNGTLLAESAETTIVFGPQRRKEPKSLVEEIPNDRAPTKRKGEQMERADHPQYRLRQNENADFKQWDPVRVAEWIKSLHNREPPKLSQDFSSLIAEHNIQGEILKAMMKEDWKEIGITKVGDLKILELEINKLG